MIPPKIATTIKANWTSPRRGQPIRAIIAHDTERPSDDTNSIDYLRRGGSKIDGSDRKVSIHVLIEPNGDSYVMVPDELGANHCGYGSWTFEGISYGPELAHNLNECTLGFELERTKGAKTPYPEDQLLAAGYWITVWRQRHGWLPILKHAQVDPKRRTDPQMLTSDVLEMYAVKASRLMITPQNPTKFKFIVPQVVYTDRSLSSRFAGSANAPVVMQSDQVVPIGDITGDWAWIATGIGFVPLNTLVRL